MSEHLPEVFERLRTVEQQINTHEAVCAERYDGILKTSAEVKKDMETVNRLLIQIGLALIAGMAAILAKLVFSA